MKKEISDMDNRSLTKKFYKMWIMIKTLVKPWDVLQVDNIEIVETKRLPKKGRYQGN